MDDLDNKLLVTRGSLAHALGISRQRVHALIAEHKIASVPVAELGGMPGVTIAEAKRVVAARSALPKDDHTKQSAAALREMIKRSTRAN